MVASERGKLTGKALTPEALARITGRATDMAKAGLERAVISLGLTPSTSAASDGRK